MAVLNFEAKNKHYNELMVNGTRYNVPKFQRNYAWDEEQWEELWGDLTSALDDEQDVHYMGYLVFQNDSTEKRTYGIIDGQQRLTTISILILAIMNQIRTLIEAGKDKENNEQRLEQLRASYIGYKDPVSLSTRPRLTLNPYNNEIFYSYLCSFRAVTGRGKTISEKLLIEAFNFFDSKVKERKLTQGYEFAALIEMVFTVITVSDDLKAYKVFETLNARGVKLSTPDLLKNFLYSLIDSEEEIGAERMQELDDVWKTIINQLGKHDFSRFLSVEWNSRHSITNKHSLFKEIRKETLDGSKAFVYLHHLRATSEVYAALQSSSDELWEIHAFKDYAAPLKTALETFDIFNIVQPQVVLMAAYSKFEPAKFVKIAGYLEAVSVRYNAIAHEATSKQEKVYNRLAQAISSGNITRLQEVRSALSEVYLSDDDFMKAFTMKTMPTQQTPKKVRYVLAQLEQMLSGGSPLKDGELALEHILPQNPDGSWSIYFDYETQEKCKHRLGNMTLLTKEENKALGNVGFEEKRKRYAQSTIRLTQKCAEYDEWTPDAIERHQEWLASLAVQRWKMDVS
jgi:Protein of unknown function DUF262/Protein of unknown function (DUF1524)